MILSGLAEILPDTPREKSQASYFPTKIDALTL
jgi:hypothetical protein